MSTPDLPEDPWPADGDAVVGLAWARLLWLALLEAPDDHVLTALGGMTHDDLRWVVVARLLHDRAGRGAS